MITFQDKVSLNTDPDIPEINKITDSNINSLKAGINTNETSINNIKNKMAYSTTEVQTDKVWIDGKPIYRIVFTGNGGDNTMIGTVNNLDTMVSISGYIKSTYGQWWCVPNYYYANNNTNYWTSLYMSSDGSIHLATGSYYNSTSPYYFICEYTKTTDVAS